MKSKPTELPQQQEPIPITLSVNTLLDGKFIPAGDPLPVSSSDDLPESLKPFVVTSDDEPEAEEEGTANYQLNVVYQVNSDGRLGRVLSRQIDRMEEENALRDYAEEQLSAPLAPRLPMPCKRPTKNPSASKWLKPNLVLDGAIKRTKLPSSLSMSRR